MVANRPLIEFFQRLQQRLAGRLPELVTLLLVVLLARSVASIVWQAATVVALPQTAEQGASMPGSQAPRAPARSARTGAQRIIAHDLFGQSPARAQAGGGSPQVPETGLNLKLYGIFSTASASRSLAIIASAGQSEKIYAVGDKLPGDAVISGIHPDYVLIRRNGALEALKLPRAGKHDLATGAGNHPSRRPAAQAGAGGTRLARLRNQLLSNPDKLASLVRVRPVFRGGTLRGYRVYPGPDSALFHRIGLHAGDLVQSVNGVRLDQPSKALNLIQSLGSASQLNLVIERAGRRTTLTVPLDN